MVWLNRILLAVGILACSVLALCPLRGLGADWCFNPFGDPCPTDVLAAGIDRLEKHIDKYGSIVAKQPDIWGEARLTKHRRQFEQVMEKELAHFRVTINAALSRSDQAYLANALAMQAALGEGPSVDAVPLVGDVNEQKIITRTGPVAVQAFDQVTVVDAAGKEIAGIGLEPTVVLDQMARYLYHLNELRRVNAGDDTADSPGYGLNLIRIPVSVLPGSRTREGFGGEITITAESYLSGEILPQTFRNLVINDLVDQLSLPMTQFLNDPSSKRILDKFAEIHKEKKKLTSRLDIEDYAATKGSPLAIVDELNQAFGSPSTNWPESMTKRGISQNVQKAVNDYLDKANELARGQAHILEEIGDELVVPAVSASRSRQAGPPFCTTEMPWVYGPDQLGHLAEDLVTHLRTSPINKDIIHYLDVQDYIGQQLGCAYEFLKARPDLWCFCRPELAQAVRAMEHALTVEEDAGIVHPVPSGKNTKVVEIRPQLLHLTRMRSEFLKAAAAGRDDLKHTTRVGLAWAIIVESALLNERLIQDMQRVAELKGCGCMVGPESWLPFFLPEPPIEAQEAFNEYVRCRWPIHVFAVDPIIQEQNVADAFSMRREMQLALSLGFVNGQISAENFMQFARRLELDMETIDLNRTIVGFGHGSNTFGWRFYPRVQSPDTKGHFGTTAEFFKGLRRDSLIRQRRLEPGTRELTALVIMPSFVPYVTIDMRANWFKLTNPSCKVLDLKDALKLSSELKSLQDLRYQCFHNCERHRAGDAALVTRAIDQLSARLPLQSMKVQAPYENTLGGFEMFSTGVTDLAPELKGFYGEPGYNQATGSALFIVGNNFSVHETEIIAGNRPVVDAEMLSRQVIAVNIPKAAALIEADHPKDEKRKVHYIDVHVATPYGVSNHLLIPAVPGKPPAPTQSEFAFGTAELAALQSVVIPAKTSVCFAVDVYDDKAKLLGCKRFPISISAGGKLCPNDIEKLQTAVRCLLVELNSRNSNMKVGAIVLTGFTNDETNKSVPLGVTLNIKVDAARLKIEPVSAPSCCPPLGPCLPANCK